jgi:hypothetical protein
MRSRCIIVALATGLTACGAGASIEPAGPDVFKVTKIFSPAEGGFERAQRLATADATRYCEDRGATFLPINPPGEGVQGPTVYTLTFRCLPAGVPRP